MANTATRHSHGRLRLSKTQKVSSVIIIASAFFIVEIAIGIKTRSLALIADAFHIFSDLLGYIAAWIAIRMSTSAKTAQFTYGYQRGEILGGFFNGAFLSALGVSVVLQSIERFTEPKDVNSPILIMIIGAAGIGSNILMAVIMGGHHGHEHGAPDNERHNDIMLDNRHRGHAHSRQERGQGHTHDVNIVGIFIHILGDAVNSLAVIVSGAIYYATGFIYADPIVSLLVGLMIIGTAIPLALRSGRLLLVGVPRHVDLTGVQEDIERITGEFSVHELHIWSLTQSKTLASMHISLSPESATRVLSIISEVKQCLHLWGIHAATIQPEIAPHAPPQMSETAPAADQTYSVAGVQPCQSKCDIDCVELTCCE